MVYSEAKFNTQKYLTFQCWVFKCSSFMETFADKQIIIIFTINEISYFGRPDNKLKHCFEIFPLSKSTIQAKQAFIRNTSYDFAVTEQQHPQEFRSYGKNSENTIAGKIKLFVNFCRKARTWQSFSTAPPYI